MKSLITRWNFDPLYPKPFSPVHKARKFSAVFGTFFAIQTKRNATRFLAIDAHIKVDLASDQWPLGILAFCCCRKHNCRGDEKGKVVEHRHGQAKARKVVRKTQSL